MQSARPAFARQDGWQRSSQNHRRQSWKGPPAHLVLNKVLTPPFKHSRKQLRLPSLDLLPPPRYVGLPGTEGGIPRLLLSPKEAEPTALQGGGGLIWSIYIVSHLDKESGK